MGKGSELSNGRRMYNFSLNPADPDDLKLIQYLENRSTTNVVREGIKLLQNGDTNTPAQPDVASLLIGLLGSNINPNALQEQAQAVLSQQNTPVSVPEEKVPEAPKKQVKKPAKDDKPKAQASKTQINKAAKSLDGAIADF